MVDTLVHAFDDVGIEATKAVRQGAVHHQAPQHRAVVVLIAIGNDQRIHRRQCRQEGQAGHLEEVRRRPDRRAVHAHRKLLMLSEQPFMMEKTKQKLNMYLEQVR